MRLVESHSLVHLLYGCRAVRSPLFTASLLNRWGGGQGMKWKGAGRDGSGGGGQGEQGAEKEYEVG